MVCSGSAPVLVYISGGTLYSLLLSNLASLTSDLSATCVTNPIPFHDTDFPNRKMSKAGGNHIADGWLSYSEFLGGLGQGLGVVDSSKKILPLNPAGSNVSSKTWFTVAKSRWLLSVNNTVKKRWDPPSLDPMLMHVNNSIVDAASTSVPPFSTIVAVAS